MPGDKKKVNYVLETSLIGVFLALVAVIFLYQVIPNDVRYWVIVGFTVAYFILLIIKLFWNRKISSS
jgi:multisubunit Na+/H+ antiporter MnhE subunit